MSTPPRTLAEAVDHVHRWLTPQALETLATQRAEDLIDDHFGLGARIRNELGLWDPHSALLQDCQANGKAPAVPLHPDDASMLILHTLWTRLHH